MYVSNERVPVPSDAGHAFGDAHELALLSRPRRAACCGSPASIAPAFAIEAAAHVGTLKCSVDAPWLEATESVKSIGDPHWKPFADDVENENGVDVVPRPSRAIVPNAA